MFSSNPEQDSTIPTPGHFNTTHWSIVLNAAGTDSEKAQTALADLCRTYWPPLFGYIQAQGHSRHDAEDLVQEFFARLLAKNYLASADRSRGRFRSFMLSSLKHFMANEWDKARALKRGGGQIIIPIDLKTDETSAGIDPADNATADKIFDRRWAMTLLDQVMARLARDYADRERGDIFESLRGVLIKDKDSLPYSEIALQLGMTEAAIKMAVQRMRAHYRELLREEIAKTVVSEDQIDEEIRHLFVTFSN